MNEYYIPPDDLDAVTRARSASFNTLNTAIDAGFDLIPTDLQDTQDEVVAARDGELTLLAKEEAQDLAIAATVGVNGSLVSIADTTPGFLGAKLNIIGAVESIVNPGANEVSTFTITPTSIEYEEFLTSGTWTKPVGAILVLIEAIGGGGGGGNEDIASANAGGGGGGAWAPFTIEASLLSATETVTIGAGGAGAPDGTTTGVGGSDGGDTTFGSFVTGTAGHASTSAAYGGSGGGRYKSDGGLDPTGYECGSGSGSNMIGLIQGGGSCTQGGAGGGHTTATATVHPGGVSTLGGDGGASNTTSATKGGNGVQPGGGGGASNNDGGGGDGAAGRVRVWTIKEYA